MVVGIERLGATGGASKARMPEMNAQRLCTDAKPTERSYGKGDSAFRRIVRFFERSMLVQLYRYTHENINALSIQKVLAAVLAIYFTVQL